MEGGSTKLGPRRGIWPGLRVRNQSNFNCRDAPSQADGHRCSPILDSRSVRTRRQRERFPAISVLLVPGMGTLTVAFGDAALRNQMQANAFPYKVYQERLFCL
eukprot:1434560-Rhodomonas_salina.3